MKRGRREDTNRKRRGDTNRKQPEHTNREWRRDTNRGRRGDTNQGRRRDTNRGRRTVLRGIAALTGTVVGCGSVVGASETFDESVSQQVDTSLPPGVTLFDLDGDGEFGATVERASSEMRDDAHADPIHVTSGGRSTVDYAASVAEPPAATTLGDLDELSYEYYEGSDDASDGGPSGPGETFLVVENDDGLHGMYLTAAGTSQSEQWQTVDVLAQVQGGSGGAGGWFEYTEIESGYDGQRFGDAVSRFGADARLVRVGVGRGDAVTPTTLDAFYDNLTVNGETGRFPDSVANRVANESPF